MANFSNNILAKAMPRYERHALNSKWAIQRICEGMIGLNVNRFKGKGICKDFTGFHYYTYLIFNCFQHRYNKIFKKKRST